MYDPYSLFVILFGCLVFSYSAEGTTVALLALHQFATQELLFVLLSRKLHFFLVSNHTLLNEV